MLILAFTFVLAIAGTSAAAVSETSNVTTPQVTNDCGSDPIINGTITVNEYGHVRPLEGATVTANSVSGVILGRATTDANGYYSMNFYSTDTTFDIVASYMGCTSQTKRITVNNGPNYPTDPNKYGTANFELTPKSATLTSTGNGQTVYIQGQNQNGFAGVLNVRVDGTTYVAYCIDLFTPIEVNDVLLVNGPLPGTTGDLPPEVEWEKVSYILNKYNPSNQNEAAAIQCAIWHFTSVHYGNYNPSAPVGTYYQYMTAPRDGRIGSSSGSETVRNRALVIINEVNAANIPSYPNNITLTPQSTTVANGGLFSPTSVTVTATVKDKDGNPLSGITVNFQTTQGTLSRTSGNTNANGQVTSTLTLRNNRDAVVTASVTGNYGNLLYDDQYAAVRKQNLVARNVLPLVISDFSTIKTTNTANVALTQTANSPVNVGDTVTYTVTATNNGPSTATGILISDIIPAGLSGVTVTPSVGTYYNGIWTIPTLANRAKATLTITGTATAAMAGLTTNNTATRIAQEQYNSRPTTTTASVYTKKADVTITNTANHSTLNVGDNGTFTIRVTNNGPDRANIQITDLLSQLPAGFTAGTPSTGSYNPTTGVWTITNLATGTANAATLVFSGVIQAAQAGTTIINHATATMTEYPQTVTIPDASIYVKKADVTLSQTGSYYQDTVTFIVTASNNGPDTATNIKISDVIPAGLTNVTFTPSAGTSYANGVWTIPSLDYLANATLKITGTATPQTTVTNTANKTSQTEYDPNTPDVTKFSVYVPSVNMYVILRPWYYDTKEDAYQTTSDCGNTIVYSLNVRNYGSDDATGVITKFTLGNGYEFIGYSIESVDTTQTNYVTYDNATRTLTWYIGFMPKNGMSYLKIIAKVIGTTATSNLTCTGTLHSVDQHDVIGSYPKTSNYSITTPTSADIEVKQTQETFTDTENNLYVTYTITVKNNGPDNATGVQITDKLPTGLTDISYAISNDNGQTWTDNDPTYNPNNGIWNIGNFNSTDQPKILKITAKVIGTGTIKNTASRTAINEKDYNYDNNAQTCALTVSGTYTPSSNMYIILRPWYYDTKEDTYQTTSDCGNTIVYSLNVRNYGSDDATGVITKFTLGNGYEFIGYSIESVDTTQTNYVTYDNATRTLTWYIGFMPKNGMSYLKIIAKVIGTTATSNLTCTGTLHSVDQQDIIGPYPKTANYSITTPTSADIEVKQTQETFTDTENNLYVTYTITVKNNGPDNATGVQITDKLPTGLTDISYAISNDNGQTWTDNDPTYNPNNGIWNIGNFNATDQPKILKITAKVIGTGTIKNTASRTAINEKDYNYDNNAQTCVLPLDQFDIINGLNDEKQISKLNYLTQDDQYEKKIYQT